jgi:AmmeMemoRadiSam system protein B
MIREPVVSGKFYPQDPRELTELIESFVEKEPAKLSAQAAILPHAGYIYSGKVAVKTVGKIIGRKRVVILGPNHTGYGKDFGVWPKGAWRTPFGEIAIDEEITDNILSSGDFIVKDELCHKFEHSIEVELPILQYFFKDFKFVPICCSISDLRTYEKVSNQLNAALRKIKDEVLIVVSTDMTHYEPDATVRKKDRQALEEIINFNADGLNQKVRKENISMCGIAPVSILLSFIKSLNVRKAQVILYQTSGDSSNDFSSVVGYAGIVVS